MNSNLLDILQYLNLSGAGAPQPMSAPPMMPMKPMAPIGNVSPLSEMPIPNNAPVPPQALPNVSGSSQRNLGPLEAFLASPSTNTLKSPLPDMGGPINPFDKGSIAAIRAAKQSLGLTEEEKREAMGTAIMQFFANMAQPGGQPGFAGSLQKITQNLHPAMQAYDQYKAGITNQNMMLAGELANRQEEHRKYQAQAMENALNRQDTAEYRKASLALQKLQHEEMTPYQREHLALKRQKLGQEDAMMNAIANPNALHQIPLAYLEKPARAQYQKDALKQIQSVSSHKNTLNTVEKMREIFDQYPDIGTNYVGVLENPEDSGKDKGFIARALTTVGKKLSDPRKLAALQKLKKYTSDLNLDTIKGIQGKTATDRMKAIIQQAAPSGVLTKEAFDAIAEKVERNARHQIDYAKKIQEGLRNKVAIADFDYDEAPRETLSDSGNVYENVPMISREEAASGKVKVYDPEGNIAEIDADKYPQALKMGFKKYE